MNKEEKSVPVWEKVTLTIDEAVAYSGIGKNKIRELTNKPFCSFLLHNGTKRLIKRKEFEKFLTVQKSI
ncbi:MAG: transposase [Lachnospiraceae bacterium]|nr:transposase [Lachnospiraceae bacterium]MBR1524904.1 transposase [Lachnospiraceae bacterium]